MGFLSTDFEFDTENLKAQSAKIAALAEDLKKEQTALRKNLDTLQDKWQTDASRAFFEKYDTKWVTQVNEYISLLKDLTTALDYAVSQYDPVASEYEKITLDTGGH